MSLTQTRSFSADFASRQVPRESSAADKEYPPQGYSPHLSLARLTPALLLSIVLWALLFGMAHLTWRLVG